ncbi:hypothetical protein RhiirA5_498794 [Rhizophagus irregularis]|uniref:Uncharacterized protein n=2 Tax=Rhizophagus irregularis TaxID=588596 RepID=A0A2I1ECP3_9GLOM|nr:hypothetical protein RhiirA5_498794 [Rhizophagus irregularis]PKC75104.1 hypothetical protein RhiirA1_529044 [Rhizophagus irregularis]PKY19881.1 hypothetical protein RhiirB3_523857 [Rhizophagus irregularis]CAB4483493.1 unnamed protein product [Rhizophagus irregularis]CAB5180402.1 unnamed protein product [Rhizophagus irregularis]
MNYNKIYNKICQPPHNQSRQLADEIRLNNTKFTIVTPRMIIKRNIKREIDDENIDINSMVNAVWNHHLTDAQREEFESLAKSINDINQNVANINSDSHNRMNRINNHQEIDPIGIFSGTEFSQRTDFESLILATFP